VLGALRQTLPPLALELNLQKTTVWGPVLVSASPPPLHSRDTPGEGHGGAGGTDQTGNAEGEVRPHMCCGGGPRGYLVHPRAHAFLLGTRKGTVRPAHLDSPPHGGLRGGRHTDKAGHVGCGGWNARFRRCVGAEPNPADE